MTVLQFVVVGVAMTAIGLSGPIRRALDAIAFVHDERLRRDRSDLLQLADATLRHRQRHRLPSTSEDEFRHFTRRALDSYADLDRLTRSPLTDLPAVDRRMVGRAVEQPMARATQLRVVLMAEVDRMRPPGPFATTDDWRHYLALSYGTMLGVDPYRRRLRTDGLEREARRAVDWMRRYVPRRTLRQWQAEAAEKVADRLWADLTYTTPRGAAPVVPGKRTTTTRSS